MLLKKIICNSYRSFYIIKFLKSYSCTHLVNGLKSRPQRKDTDCLRQGRRTYLVSWLLAPTALLGSEPDFGTAPVPLPREGHTVWRKRCTERAHQTTAAYFSFILHILLGMISCPGQEKHLDNGCFETSWRQQLVCHGVLQPQLVVISGFRTFNWQLFAWASHARIFKPSRTLAWESQPVVTVLRWHIWVPNARLTSTCSKTSTPPASLNYTVAGNASCLPLEGDAPEAKMLVMPSGDPAFPQLWCVVGCVEIWPGASPQTDVSFNCTLFWCLNTTNGSR